MAKVEVKDMGAAIKMLTDTGNALGKIKDRNSAIALFMAEEGVGTGELLARLQALPSWPRNDKGAAVGYNAAAKAGVPVAIGYNNLQSWLRTNCTLSDGIPQVNEDGTLVPAPKKADPPKGEEEPKGEGAPAPVIKLDKEGYLAVFRTLMAEKRDNPTIVAHCASLIDEVNANL